MSISPLSYQLCEFWQISLPFWTHETKLIIKTEFIAEDFYNDLTATGPDNCNHNVNFFKSQNVDCSVTSVGSNAEHNMALVLGTVVICLGYGLSGIKSMQVLQ